MTTKYTMAMLTVCVALVGAAGAGGYLSGSERVDAAKFLPPPPAMGSVQFADDEDVFLRMRALKGSGRWQLATADDDTSTQALLKDFSCALGIDIDKKNAPHTSALLEKIRDDAGYAIGNGKNSFKRPRPLVGNDLPICVDRLGYASSYSYPSGHTTLSWTVASVLMALAPDKAAPIAARGRGYGESRAVCGVHWASDVEAGRLAGSAVFAALMGNETFRHDLKIARAEMDALRKTAAKPDEGFCRVQALADVRPW